MWDWEHISLQHLKESIWCKHVYGEQKRAARNLIECMSNCTEKYEKKYMGIKQRNDFVSKTECSSLIITLFYSVILIFYGKLYIFITIIVIRFSRCLCVCIRLVAVVTNFLLFLSLASIFVYFDGNTVYHSLCVCSGIIYNSRRHTHMSTHANWHSTDHRISLAKHIHNGFISKLYNQQRERKK